MFFKESARLGVSNPVVEDFSAVSESLLADLKVSEVRAIYPMIRAINSGRLTKNYTFYPAESLMGKNKADDPTGYASFVKPYGKPILREHQAQKVMGLMGPIEEADVPMGRVIYAGFRRRVEKRDGAATLPSKRHIPGSVQGDGTMFVVPAITDPESITRVLGGAYHTVSIGSRVDNVTESISNQNIAQLRRDGKELPPYERGQLYEGKLSYWKMGEVRGVEVSFVNVPSDEYAGVTDPDIGVEGIRLLVAEKKPGKKNEFAFYDAKTAEEVKWEMDEFSFDESHFVDSANVGHNIWWLNNKENLKEVAPVTESAGTEPEVEEQMDIKTILSQSLDKIIELYEDTHKDAVLEKFSTDQDVSLLVEGNAERIEDAELFAKVSDFATEICGNWDESAAKLALGLYLHNEGTLSVPIVEDDKKITIGELYGIEGDLSTIETNLTGKDWKGLPDTCFAGPDRTIPITNFESAIYAMKLFKEAKPDHLKVLAAFTIPFGISVDETDIFFSPIQIASESVFHFGQIKEYIDLAPLYDNVKTISESYGLIDEQSEQVQKFLEQISEDTFKPIEGAPLFAFTEQSVKPVVLGTAFLLNYFMNNESANSTRNTLVTLVGLVRKNKLTKEDLDQAFEAYNVFGTSVLKKFLENVPIKEEIPAPVIENTQTEEETPTSVETLPDPVAATEQTSDGKTKESIKKTNWFGLEAKPKRSGKTPVIKEKR